MLRLTMTLLALQTATSMVSIPAGSFQSLYGKPGDGPTKVAAFRIDRDPVTRRDYLAFVRERVEWQRSKVNGLFADRRGYLADWSGDMDAGSPLDLRRPVSGVSWFAARAYCAARGHRLPTAAEWEYVAASNALVRNAARDKATVQHLVTVYATRARPLSPVENGETNAYGVRALHGIAWEWVADFNSVLVSDDSRGVGGRDHDLFCASAAIGAPDPTNYPAFLRYALRAGLSGRSTLETLGFRCAT
jgi:formylglycine-generating enzyme